MQAPEVGEAKPSAGAPRRSSSWGATQKADVPQCHQKLRGAVVLCIQGQKSLWGDAETSSTCTLPAGQNSWDVWQMYRTIYELGRHKLSSQQTPEIIGLVQKRCPLFPSCFTSWLTDQRNAQFEKYCSLNANPSWFKETNWTVSFGEHCHQLINSFYDHSDLFGHVAVPSSNTGQRAQPVTPALTPYTELGLQRGRGSLHCTEPSEQPFRSGRASPTAS